MSNNERRVIVFRASDIRITRPDEPTPPRTQCSEPGCDAWCIGFTHCTEHDDLEQLRRDLERAEGHDAAVSVSIPLCRDCGGPMGMAPATGRSSTPGALLRCGPCARARKQRRRASRGSDR